VFFYCNYYIIIILIVPVAAHTHLWKC